MMELKVTMLLIRRPVIWAAADVPRSATLPPDNLIEVPSRRMNAPKQQLQS